MMVCWLSLACVELVICITLIVFVVDYVGLMRRFSMALVLASVNIMILLASALGLSRPLIAIFSLNRVFSKYDPYQFRT